MPDITLGQQLIDLEFDPFHDCVYTALVTGEVKAFTYDDHGECVEKWKLRPAKKSCRGLSMNPSGDQIFSVFKDKSMHIINPERGKTIQTLLSTHDAPLSRVKCFLNMAATGDDDGTLKLWDSRNGEVIRSYSHHSDYLSDMCWFSDKKQLVVTSGDGTLSVVDVRSNKNVPLAQSEDQEDELLSLALVKNSKCVVGTQLGVISIFDRKKGWSDCVDRFLGHPESVDAIVPLTPDVVATGSSDGFVRVVQILPNKLLGVVADHKEFPVERLKLDRSAKWLGSASHDEILKLTDVSDALEDSDTGSEDDDQEEEVVDEQEGEDEEDDDTSGDSKDREDDRDSEDNEDSANTEHSPSITPVNDHNDEASNDSDDPVPEASSKKRRKNNFQQGVRKKATKGTSEFFADL